jgi:hypothetical protein
MQITGDDKILFINKIGSCPTSSKLPYGHFLKKCFYRVNAYCGQLFHFIALKIFIRFILRDVTMYLLMIEPIKTLYFDDI